MRILIPVTCLALIGGRLAAAESADRLAALERRLDLLEAENAQLRRQQKGGDHVPAMAAGREARLTVGGFVHANFESGGVPDARFNGINDRFVLRRIRPSVSGRFTEHVDFKFEADFGNNAIAPKSGASGQLTDACVAWTRSPAASVRLGQFKTPFGFEQIVSDTKVLTVERALANDRLTLGRQIGAALFGEVAGRRVAYSAGAFNGAGTNTGGNDNEKFLWVARASAIAFDGQIAAQKAKLTIGVNGFTTADKGTFVGRRVGSGVDAQFAIGPAELQAEWLRNAQHPATGRATTAAGWSLLGRLNVTTHWQGVLRFERFDSDTGPGASTTDLWTCGVNYLLKGDDLKLSLNYLAGQPPAPAVNGGRFLARVQVIF